MKNIRMIDAIALKKSFKNHPLCNDVWLHYSRELIDDAPTIEPFEPDYVGAERAKARQRGYEDGYHNGMKIGKTLNPKIKQGEWAVDKSGVKWCKFCGASEISIWSNFCHNCGADMRGDENNGK